MYDKVPVVSGVLATVVGTVGVSIPGPSRTEWSAAIVSVLALAVREFVWWFRSRKK